MKRALAEQMGAHVVVDPAETPVMQAWTDAARSVKRAGALIFECVGTPGVLGEVLKAAPWAARVVVAGVCLEPDPIFAAGAHARDQRPVRRHSLARGFRRRPRRHLRRPVDVSKWISGHSDIDGAVAAFDAATDPTKHTRMLVHPDRG